MANDPVPLREYVDMCFAAQEKAVGAALVAQKEAVSAALAAADRAVAKAETASDKRFESVNEFRAALSDSSRLLMPRTEAEQRFGALDEKIGLLTVRANAKDDRGRGMGDVWGFVIGAIGILAAIVAIVWRVK